MYDKWSFSIRRNSQGIMLADDLNTREKNVRIIKKNRKLKNIHRNYNNVSTGNKGASEK